MNTVKKHCCFISPITQLRTITYGEENNWKQTIALLDVYSSPASTHHFLLAEVYSNKGRKDRLKRIVQAAIFHHPAYDVRVVLGVETFQGVVMELEFTFNEERYIAFHKAPKKFMTFTAPRPLYRINHVVTSQKSMAKKVGSFFEMPVEKPVEESQEKPVEKSQEKTVEVYREANGWFTAMVFPSGKSYGFIEDWTDDDTLNLTVLNLSRGSFGETTFDDRNTAKLVKKYTVSSSGKVKEVPVIPPHGYSIKVYQGKGGSFIYQPSTSERYYPFCDRDVEKRIFTSLLKSTSYIYLSQGEILKYAKGATLVDTIYFDKEYNII